MQLHYTQKSHYARKNRILIDALSLEVELINVGNVADSEPLLFANNPLMKVPVLVDGCQTIFDSDNISTYLVRKYDPKDQFRVLNTDIELLNARAVMNGVMAAEVEIIIADRTGIDITRYERFNKFRAIVIQGVDWLEKNFKLFSETPDYTNFHLVCMWEHLLLYDMFNLSHPQLSQHVRKLLQLDFISNSSPH